MTGGTETAAAPEDLMEKRCHAHILANLVDRFLLVPEHIPADIVADLNRALVGLRKFGDPRGANGMSADPGMAPIGCPYCHGTHVGRCQTEQAKLNRSLRKQRKVLRRRIRRLDHS